MSLKEAEYVYEEGAELLIVGTGQYGFLELSDEARSYFEKEGCRVMTKSTNKAIHAWNTSSEKVIGLFHITC
jgi:hypothetical protein